MTLLPAAAVAWSKPVRKASGGWLLKGDRMRRLLPFTLLALATSARSGAAKLQRRRQLQGRRRRLGHPQRRSSRASALRRAQGLGDGGRPCIGPGHRQARAGRRRSLGIGHSGNRRRADHQRQCKQCDNRGRPHRQAASDNSDRQEARCGKLGSGNSHDLGDDCPATARSPSSIRREQGRSARCRSAARSNSVLRTDTASSTSTSRTGTRSRLSTRGLAS